jgi:ribosomal protein S18 acetylase RimI-like enzyme
MNGEYKLRKAVKEDHELIFEIKKSALGEYITQTWGWDEALQRKMHENEMSSETIYMIESNGTVIGTVGINEKDESIVICRMYIIDKFQSKGFGRRIINKIIEDNSGKKIKLGVLKVNPRAKKLYERLGFKVYGEENKHYRMIYDRNNDL